MSTFSGVINEYHLISIDRFTENSRNYESTTYFLSHCHSDHMEGLSDQKFFELLQQRGFSKIYLSDVSEHLLKNDPKFCHLTNYLVSLPLEEPTIIRVPDKDGRDQSRVVVTLLTAGHCPGSVMFLIEGDNGRVLYTGDFRLPVGSAARLNSLHDETDLLKPLDSLYVDTTFCNKQSLYIPTREQCLDAVIPLVESWLSKGSNYIVSFACPAQYAYEFLFVEIFKRFGEKTHVSEEKKKKYKGIKNIEDAVTSIPWDARIHACTFKEDELFKQKLYFREAPCGYCTADERPINVRLIKPSAIFFRNKTFSEIVHYDSRMQMYRVCYSTHSSLDEIRDMVKYLKPKKVIPNVVVKQTVNEILDLLNAPLSNDASENDVSDSESDVSLLGTLKNGESNGGDASSADSILFFDDCYNIREHCKTQNTSLLEEQSFEISSTLLSPKNDQKCVKNRVELRSIVTANISQVSVSPLKWNYQPFSPDKDNSFPNTHISSSGDKSESESLLYSHFPSKSGLNQLRNQAEQCKLNFINRNYSSTEFIGSTANGIAGSFSSACIQKSTIIEDSCPSDLKPLNTTKKNQQSFQESCEADSFNSSCTQKSMIVEDSCSPELKLLNKTKKNSQPFQETCEVTNLEKYSSTISSCIIDSVNLNNHDNEIKNDSQYDKEGILKINPFIKEDSESKVSNMSVPEIFASIYNSESEDSEQLEINSSWRKNKLMIDTLDEAISSAAHKSCQKSSQNHLPFANNLNACKSSIDGNINYAVKKNSESVNYLAASKEALKEPNLFFNDMKPKQSISELGSGFNEALNSKTVFNSHSKFITNQDQLLSNQKNQCYSTFSDYDEKIGEHGRINLFTELKRSSGGNSTETIINSCTNQTLSKKTEEKAPLFLTQNSSHKSSNVSSNSLHLSTCDLPSLKEKFPFISEQNISNSSLRFSSQKTSPSTDSNLSIPKVENLKNQAAAMAFPTDSMKRHNSILGPNFSRKSQDCRNSPDIICLEEECKENMCIDFEQRNTGIEVIDLSSDEECDVLGLKNDSVNFRTKLNIRFGNNSASEAVDDDSDIEVLDSSPSLLVPKFKCDKPGMYSESEFYRPLTCEKKRKSDEGQDFLPLKSPRLEERSQSPDIFDGNSDIDSTPEDFFLPAQKSYLSL